MTTTLFDKEAMRRRVGGLRREIIFAVLLTVAAIIYFAVGGLRQPTQQEAAEAPGIDRSTETKSTDHIR